MYRLRGGMKISVKTQTGMITTLEVETSNTIENEAEDHSQCGDPDRLKVTYLCREVIGGLFDSQRLQYSKGVHAAFGAQT